MFCHLEYILKIEINENLFLLNLLSIVTRIYDILMILPSCRGRRPAVDYGSKQGSADDSSTQELQYSGSGRDHISSTPFYDYKLR